MSLRTARVDLHMHSCLSPCGDAAMTPASIAGYACLNGLDAIALTDHNISFNVPAIMACGEAYGINVVPGMELETSEEIHVVCLFPDFDSLSRFQQTVFDSYEQQPNKPAIFGDQLIMNEDDEIIGEYPHMLLSPTGISIDDVFGMVDSLGGIAYPAHVDRDSYSALTTLGDLPYGYPHSFVEISYDCDPESLVNRYPSIRDLTLIHASDAHYLHRIPEKGAELEVEENTPQGIINALKSMKRGLIL